VTFACGRESLGISQDSSWATKVLTIEHRQDVVNVGQSKVARAIDPETAIALTSVH